MLRRSTRAVSTRSPLDVVGPRADVFFPPLRELPVHSSAVAQPTQHPAWEFMAAHGGSGAGLLARLSAAQPLGTTTGAPQQTGEAPEAEPAYGVSAGAAWPDPHLEPTGVVVVVAQTTMRGLGWARDAAAQHLAGRTPSGLRLLGLVTVADQPGRLPQPLAAAKGLLAGAYPHTWHVPYVPEYRLLTGLPGEQVPPVHPAVADVLTAIRSLVSRKGQQS